MVKNINLGYNLPKHLIRHLDLSSARLNFTIENLHLFATRKGLNPQLGFNGIISSYLTTPRIISFGLKADF
jgi:hypothetical protein